MNTKKKGPHRSHKEDLAYARGYAAGRKREKRIFADRFRQLEIAHAQEIIQLENKMGAKKLFGRLFT